MSCRICSFTTGVNYKLLGNCLCRKCGTEVLSDGKTGTYLGISQNLYHGFRIHPSVLCSGCGRKLTEVTIPCEDSGYEEQIATLFNIKIIAE